MRRVLMIAVNKPPPLGPPSPGGVRVADIEEAAEHLGRPFGRLFGEEAAGSERVTL